MMIRLKEEITRLDALMDIYQRQSREQLDGAKDTLRLKIRAVQEGFFVRLVVMDQGSSGSGEKQVKKFKISEKGSGDVLFAGNMKEAKPGKKGDRSRTAGPPFERYKVLGQIKRRIEVALHAGRKEVDIPASKLKVRVVEILKEEGFVKNFRLLEDGKQGMLRVNIKLH